MNLFNCAKRRGCDASYLPLLLTQSIKTKSVNSILTDFNENLTLLVHNSFLLPKQIKIN